MKKLLLVLFALFFSACNYNAEKVTIQTDHGDFTFNVELAKTKEERAKGLMFREELAQNEGMFFVYDEPSSLSFWMKNTLVHLDIIFVDEDLKVVSIQKQVEPCPSEFVKCPSYPSEKPAKYVLEIQGGLVGKYEIEEGDQLSLNFEI